MRLTFLRILYLILLLLCISWSSTQVNFTTEIDENGQIINEILITVDKYLYSAQYFELYKDRSRNAAVIVEDYENGAQRGIRLTETLKNYSIFILEYSKPSSKIEPQLLRVNILKTNLLSSNIYRFLGDVDPSFFTKWGAVQFTYSIIVPGEIVGHNGTEVSSQNILWQFTSHSGPKSIFVEWVQRKDPTFKWIIYILIISINLSLILFSVSSPVVFQMSVHELISFLIASIFTYILGTVAINYVIKGYLPYFSNEDIIFSLTTALFVLSISLLIYTNSFERLLNPKLSNISRVSTTGVNYPLIATIPEAKTKTASVALDKNSDEICDEC